MRGVVADAELAVEYSEDSHLCICPIPCRSGVHELDQPQLQPICNADKAMHRFCQPRSSDYDPDFAYLGRQELSISSPSCRLAQVDVSFPHS